MNSITTLSTRAKLSKESVANRLSHLAAPTELLDSLYAEYCHVAFPGTGKINYSSSLADRIHTEFLHADVKQNALMALEILGADYSVYSLDQDLQPHKKPLEADIRISLTSLAGGDLDDLVIVPNNGSRDEDDCYWRATEKINLAANMARRAKTATPQQKSWARNYLRGISDDARARSQARLIGFPED